MIQIAKRPKIQARPLFQFGDRDLGGCHIKLFLEARQALNVFLVQNESRCRHGGIQPNQDTNLPKPEGDADRHLHRTVLICRILRSEQRTRENYQLTLLRLRLLFEQELFQTLPAILALIESTQLQTCIRKMKRVIQGPDCFFKGIAPTHIQIPREVSAISIVGRV